MSNGIEMLEKIGVMKMPTRFIARNGCATSKRAPRAFQWHLSPSAENHRRLRGNSAAFASLLYPFGGP